MSKRSNSDIRYSEMMEDLQAAFLMITNNPNEILKSKSDLIRALQISGRNPNPRNIDKYWKAYERIGIDEFIEIGKDEHELTENELIAVFRDIDVDNNGYISHREMIEALTLTGDGMNKREANELIQTADVNRDNKIDYKEFARLILGTIRDAKQEAKRKTKKIPINKNHRYSSREDVRRSPAFNRRDNRDNRDDLDNRDFLMETLDRSPRRKNSERRHHHQRTGSRLSFKDEKEEFSDDFGIDLKRRPSSPHRRKSSPKPYHRKESNRNDELARSTDSLRSLMRATSLSNLDVRRMSHVSHTSHTSGHRVKRDDSKEKLNDKENKAKKFHSSGKLYEFKLEAANKASTRSAQEPKNLKKWPLKTTKGGIYINEQTKSLFSNSFVLDLKTSANVHFSIQTSTTQLHSNPDLVNMDICLLVVKNEKNLSLTAITENKNNNKWVGTEKLEAGTYFLFPFTSGCHLKRRAFEVSSNEKLFKSDLNGKKTLTTKFKNALNTVFDMFDLDSNGRLSRNEFNFYSIISSTEEVGDEDWDMLKRLVELNKGELTREGFLRLYEIEAENEDFNVDDVYDRLFNLGFNKALEIDQSCPFAINVSCDTDNFDLLLGEIFDLKSCNRYFGHIIQQKGNKKQIKGFDKAEFHEYHNYFWSIIQVDNTSNRETIDLKINASKSENCISNLSGMEEIATIKPGKSKIVMFLAPNNPNKDWTIRYDAHF